MIPRTPITPMGGSSFSLSQSVLSIIHLLRHSVSALQHALNPGDSFGVGLGHGVECVSPPPSPRSAQVVDALGLRESDLNVPRSDRNSEDAILKDPQGRALCVDIVKSNLSIVVHPYIPVPGSVS